MGQYNIDESVIKKPNQEKNLTPEQELEWKICAEDIEYWMQKYAYVQSPTGKALFRPRPYQLRAVAVRDSRFTVGLWSRQTGKTTAFGIMKLHAAIFNKGRHIGITSYKLTNCKDYMERIKFTYEHLPQWMKPPVIEYNRYNITFAHDSSIVSQVTKENTFRGITLTDIVVDELAFVPEKITVEFWGSLLPSISAAGEMSTTKLTVISTPNGSSGTFAHVWFEAVAGTNGFIPLEAKYDEVPGRTLSFAKSMISKFGKDKFDQEFRCRFISTKGTLVQSSVIETLSHKAPVRVIGDLSIFVDSFVGRKVGIACDVSDGIGKDYHCMQFVDLETFEQIAEYRNNTLNQTMYTKEIIRAIKLMFTEGASEVYYTIENNGLGAGVMRLIENYNDPLFDKAQLISDIEGNKLGILTTSKNKIKGCIQLKDMIEERVMKINSDKFINELKFFIRTGPSYKAEEGMHDDLVMAMVLFMNMLTILMNYEDKVFDTMTELDITHNDDDHWGIIF